MAQKMIQEVYLCIDVAAKEHEEADDVEVAGADGVVQGGDALVVGGRRVLHLPRRLLHQLQLSLEGGVEQEGERVEADPPVVPARLDRRPALLFIGVMRFHGNSFEA